MVMIPSMKSVFASGIGTGFQRSWFGGVGTSLKGPLRISFPVSSPAGSKGLCVTEGRMR